ncbi:uncharacterized protein BDZ99DRAFT_465603 [Mytilinidion resinicola]|uniref:Uncharacterized protein n=1 Tax=Mytilinidion resinicola TaxID=574789 RepID=A0A6A6YE08_9PEZI|nr:uncharacterized protein BDZ99DRAFT_465603 [Mytilinidion resinicola]KAF2806829.1 hypothetical protein BDZ99DRAFT_465603 [Mytilinidion resinicola]
MLLRTSVHASQLDKVHLLFATIATVATVAAVVTGATCNPCSIQLYSHSLAPQYNSCFPH